MNTKIMIGTRTVAYFGGGDGDTANKKAYDVLICALTIADLF